MWADPQHVPSEGVLEDMLTLHVAWKRRVLAGWEVAEAHSLIPFFTESDWPEMVAALRLLESVIRDAPEAP